MVIGGDYTDTAIRAGSEYVTVQSITKADYLPGTQRTTVKMIAERLSGRLLAMQIVRRLLILERFLQLTGDLIGRGIHGPLHHFVGTCERLVERLFDRRLAHRDQPCLAGGELLS